MSVLVILVSVLKIVLTFDLDGTKETFLFTVPTEITNYWDISIGNEGQIEIQDPVVLMDSVFSSFRIISFDSTPKLSLIYFGDKLVDKIIDGNTLKTEIIAENKTVCVVRIKESYYDLNIYQKCDEMEFIKMQSFTNCLFNSLLPDFHQKTEGSIKFIYERESILYSLWISTSACGIYFTEEKVRK